MKGSSLWQNLSRSNTNGGKFLKLISQEVVGTTPLPKVLERSGASKRLCLARRSATALTIALTAFANKEERKGATSFAEMPKLRDASFPNAKPALAISLVG